VTFFKLFAKNAWQSCEQMQIKLEEQSQKYRQMESRVAFLEQRLLNYYTNRWDALDKVADYLVGAELDGDYLEFGVFEGKTFAYAYKVMAPLFPKMRYIAFDSFEGLPEPTGVDAENDFSSSFVKGQFRCGKDQFMANLEAANEAIDLSRVHTVQGWFHESLRDDNPAISEIKLVSAAWIDCDLYESTVPVLDFLTDRLSVGSVLLFDDWRCFRNLADYGEQKACREWLSSNPQIKLNPFLDFGFHGMSFTVAAC
jgi:O-methyltransferase